MNQVIEQSTYLSRLETADILGVTPRTVDRYARVGKLIKYLQPRTGSKVWYLRIDVENLEKIKPKTPG